MKHTALSAFARIRPCALLLLAALSACILLLTAACGTRPAQPPRPSVSTPAPEAPAALNTSALNPVVDVRDVNRALTDSEMQNYAGSATCVSCHKQAAASHARSSHARTFHLISATQDAPAFRNSRPVTDTHINFTYHTGAAGGKCLITGKGKRGQAGSIAAAYALGTGRTGVTYLGEDTAGQWLELRLSYFPKAHTWDFTPASPKAKT